MNKHSTIREIIHRKYLHNYQVDHKNLIFYDEILIHWNEDVGKNDYFKCMLRYCVFLFNKIVKTKSLFTASGLD